MDDGYLHFVASLLQDSDLDDALVTQLDLIAPPVLTFETGESDDFLPSQKEFLLRDRAFSWDITLEEQVHANIHSAAAENAKGFGKNDSGNLKKGRKFDVVNIKSENRANKRPCIKNEFTPDQPTIQEVNENDISNSSISSIFMHASATASLVSSVLVASVDIPQMQVLSNPSDNNQLNSEILIGAYTKEQRKQRIDRFRAKKKRRIWRKQIKYDCRKRLADTRPRIKGRFVSRKGGACGDIDIEGDNENCSPMDVHDLDSIYAEELLQMNDVDIEEVTNLLA
eukprot:gene13552-28746_t